MITFRCACGARCFFENTRCLACHRELAFLPWAGQMSAIEPTSPGGHRALLDDALVRKCSNYSEQGVCNWLVRHETQGARCQACVLNRVVPDLSQAENRALWATMESAKRRLLYSLNRLGLPVRPKDGDGGGLAFDIKRDTPDERVVTGHSDGLITLNLSEADPVSREETRVQLAERYRTPLGHFRHEIGHYYWDLLIDGSSWIGPYRALFGDERQDYAKALEAHYQRPLDSSWRGTFVSAYASSHPWEDWAETWAHLLHIVDTLDTAHEFGFASVSGYDATSREHFARVIADWSELSLALNAMNRSMGQPDAYPFDIAQPVREKLTFVHRVVVSATSPGS